MGENVESKKVKEKTSERKKLSVPSTVIITVAATACALILARIIYFFVTGY